jgi:hypothetical protein
MLMMMRAMRDGQRSGRPAQCLNAGSEILQDYAGDREWSIAREPAAGLCRHANRHRRAAARSISLCWLARLLERPTADLGGREALSWLFTAVNVLPQAATFRLVSRRSSAQRAHLRIAQPATVLGRQIGDLQSASPRGAAGLTLQPTAGLHRLGAGAHAVTSRWITYPTKYSPNPGLDSGSA